ncbi:hypothetical protein EIN_372030 [Entamoeba invadens IP1]|uniref:Uncharacterized protein n=1 Tax=Entamoeba invadens IP1 TaxID=370355 RepID=A0A0A1UC20_ENTIV|nr:hypothetical protein EIN_372030 [Entamoeba invadens IP1]ELP92781.1 hypothetical protein EIN_372030 [Entamoeba invadens IP1]|eukprot:XP_004259552.1 hypothetical protein EIN_372030 [Entamoeba invadens IP1]
MSYTAVAIASSPIRDEKRTFKSFRDYIVEQQAVFIALLNQFGDVTITRPTKKSVLTQQRIRVETITIGNETIDISSFVDKRCAARYALDISNGILEKTAIRRQTANKIMETHHMLTDLLFEYGYLFETYFTSGKNNTPKMELVRNIIENKNMIFNRVSIIKTGNLINRLLCSKLSECRVVTLQAADPELMAFLERNQSYSPELNTVVLA